MENNNEKRSKTSPAITRRQVWQMYQHIQKSLDWAVENRRLQRDDTLGVYMNLDEMVAYLFSAKTRLARICNLLWECKLDDLEVYK